jgi:predicted pyridoxine 5'-phosphate oxidase superfamily flavin-nucleotide-binding protein
MGVFHEGEREVQRRVGVAATARELGHGIGPIIPPGARPFLEGQRIAVLAGLDGAGRVWTSLLAARPGFISAPDETTLRIAAAPPAVDPIIDCLGDGALVGVLVFDPVRRRRLRLNGHVMSGDAAAVQISVAEVFGNCPKYIQARTLEAETAAAAMPSVRRGSVLTASQQRAIQRSDTLFIGSVHERTGADASHRGGRPGFVRVVDPRRLRLPDYAGNNMFQTLGNISKDPRVGLLFVDFASGTTQQLTGRARILWDSASFSDLPGAKRAVDIEVDLVVELEGRVAAGSRLVAPSPFNP